MLPHILFSKKLIKLFSAILALCHFDDFPDGVRFFQFAEAVNKTLRPLTAGPGDDSIHGNGVLCLYLAFEGQALVLIRAPVCGGFEQEVGDTVPQLVTMGVVFAVGNNIFSLDFADVDCCLLYTSDAADD